MASRQRDDNRTRILLAQQCARIMDEEGVKDFLTAKRKAATRMRISNKALLPNNVEIEQALVEHQRLFKADERVAQLRILRETAVEAMRFFDQFRPRLVGSVLSGTATRHSDVNLHLFDIFLDGAQDSLRIFGAPATCRAKRIRVFPGARIQRRCGQRRGDDI